MIVWCRCGVIHGGWTGAVAVAFSGAASGVGALAAPRRASGAWRAEPRPRPRPPHPMATRQDTAPARGGDRCRGVALPLARITSPAVFVDRTTIFSHCRGLCRSVPTLSLSYELRTVSVTAGLCPQPTLSRHSRSALLRDSALGLYSGTRLPVLLRQL